MREYAWGWENLREYGSWYLDSGFISLAIKADWTVLTYNDIQFNYILGKTLLIIIQPVRNNEFLSPSSILNFFYPLVFYLFCFQGLLKSISLKTDVYFSTNFQDFFFLHYDAPSTDFHSL